VSLSVDSGEIVALVGQNGSGKSTLVKVLSGLHEPDPGAEIRVRAPGGGMTAEPAAVAEALHFIHQDLGLIPQLSTVENLDLGRALGIHAWLPSSRRAEDQRAAALMAQFGADVDVRVPVGQLSPADRTLVAIGRALRGWRQTGNVLVLDEPTAALEGPETARLFEAMRRTASAGTGIVFISHHLDEVMDLADRIVVLRDGRVVSDVARSAVDHDELVRLITGRELAILDVRAKRVTAGTALAVMALRGERITDVSFSIAAGEVLGVTGLLGSGRDELASLVFGARPRRAGKVRVGDRQVQADDPRTAIKAGMAFVPADRRQHGAIMTMLARENLTLSGTRGLRTRLGRLSRRLETDEAWRWTEAVALSPADPERQLMLYSGGNQQKVVLAKWLRIAPRVLLLDEPTQGVDVGAKASIYQLVARVTADGAAVLISSSDPKELALLCDRVIVLRRGRIATQLGAGDVSEDLLVQETLSALRDAHGEPTPNGVAL
jgi:ribose transport system ATP-binding protein